MHYGFDTEMDGQFPGSPLERSAGDLVVHCTTRSQAEAVLDALAERMEKGGLLLQPDKTRIVYCKHAKRRAEYAHTSFTFLGFTFRARKAHSKDGQLFSSFLQAMSTQALRAEVDQLRALCGYLIAPLTT